MEKIDLKKDLKHLYQASAKEVVQLEVPNFLFLMIDGQVHSQEGAAGRMTND